MEKNHLCGENVIAIYASMDLKGVPQKYVESYAKEINVLLYF